MSRRTKLLFEAWQEDELKATNDISWAPIADKSREAYLAAVAEEEGPREQKIPKVVLDSRGIVWSQAPNGRWFPAWHHYMSNEPEKPLVDLVPASANDQLAERVRAYATRCAVMRIEPSSAGLKKAIEGE